jgi:HAD superfamily phosphoserine phosphatase-like hydrolase
MSNNTTKIAVFDFDGTIYKGDATKEFCWFYYRKKPFKAYYFIIQLAFWMQYRLGLLSTTQFKSKFLQFINDNDAAQIDVLVALFWTKKKKLVRGHLIDEITRLKKEGVHIVVVSASPELFIKTFCLSLGVDTVLGSELKVLNNKYSLLVNCRGQEKLKRIKRDFTDFEIIAAYSDNEDDDVLLNMAKNGHWVDKKGKLIPFLQK